MRNTLNILLLAALTIVLSGCGREEAKIARTSGYEDFMKQYNRYILNWLNEQKAATEKAQLETEAKLLAAEGQERETAERHLIALKREEEKWNFRLGLGDYFRFSKPEDIPADLIWEDGMEHEEIGDPRAIKGGTFRQFMMAFPPTLRPFGDNSNNGFRGTLYDEIDIPLVGLHPKTTAMIPGLAKRWAVSPDGRTVYFEIAEAARYSDGVSVRAGDFLFNIYIRISDDIVNPYAKQFFRENVANITAYGERMLSISLPEAQLYAPALAGALTPSPPHFYAGYGPDYTERYQWKFPPTTGAYEVLPEDIVKGVSITQTRVKDWWAKDRKYYKHRFNPDRIVYTIVRDEPKAFELFRAGELDSFHLTRPEYWYEKSEIDPVYQGYIERHTFYNQYPAIPYGLYLNVTKPLLDDKQIRIGIQHAMNWQKVIDVIHRSDYKRLDAFNQGYLLFSDPAIKARPFSVSKARAAFREAGFTETDRDGILRRPDGTKLSISLSYRANPNTDKMLTILREEAKACGFDLRLDSNEATVDYKKVMLKQHEMSFTAWVITPPIPDFHQFLHSSNAYDERGNIKPQTNNIFAWGRADTDMLSEKARFARTEEELRETTYKLQRIIHDEAIFVPAYTVDFVRMGSWRWLRWPDSEQTRFCAPIVYEPMEVHVHWIDDQMKKETLDAKRAGRSFGEVNRIFDDYRFPEATKPADAETPVEEPSGEIIAPEPTETEVGP
jgi:microcin C transport system substrate-binding protein